jgi:hypothetical protein
MLDPGSEILHNHIGSAGELFGDFHAARILQVYRDAFLVPMEVGRVVKLSLLRFASESFDAKDGCAEIGKDLGARRSGSNRGEVHD